MNTVSNLAYDYSQFEEKSKKPQIEQIVKQKVAVKKRLSVAKAAFYVVVAVAMLSMLLYGKATQAELEVEYATTVKAINTLKNENIILQNKLDSELSLKNIEEIAGSELGLVKADNSQIETIDFNIVDKAEVVKKQPLWSSISSWFVDLVN